LRQQKNNHNVFHFLGYKFWDSSNYAPLYFRTQNQQDFFPFCWQILTFKIPPQHKGRRPPHGLVLRSAAQVAKAMAGMHHFPPLRPFEPGAASALMATLLIHDLAKPEGVRGTQM